VVNVYVSLLLAAIITASPLQNEHLCNPIAFEAVADVFLCVHFLGWLWFILKPEFGFLDLMV